MIGSLRRLWAAYWMELRLLCLHWTYPLLHLLWAALLHLLVRNLDLGTAYMALENDLRFFSFALIPLVGMFVAGASASRSDRVRFTAIESSFPMGAEVLIGRWLATVTGLSGALVTPLVFAALQGPAASWLVGAPIFLLEGVIVLAFMTAVGWCMVTLLGARRWVYPLLAGVWLFMLLLTRLLREVEVQLPATTLAHVMSRNLGDSYELWGRLLQWDLPFWFNLFYAAGAVLLMALLIGVVEARRYRRLPVLAGALALAAAVTAGTAAFQYAQTLHQWGAQADANMRDVSGGLRDAQDPARTPETVERYNITADLSNPAHPRFEAQITVRNRNDAPLESLYLTLNRQLTVTDSSLPHTREQDLVKLIPPAPLAPGQSIDVTLRYEGPIIEVRRDYDTLPRLRFFTREEGVRLSYRAAWYPMAGRAWYHFEMPVSPGWGPPGSAWTHSPAAFHLTVTAPERFGVVSNLPATDSGAFAGTGATWVMLMASPTLQVETHGSLTLAAAASELAPMRAVVPEINEYVAFLRQYFPSVPVEAILVTNLDSGHGIPDGSPPTDGHLLVYGAGWMFGNQNPYWLFQAIAADFLPDEMRSDGGFDKELASFLWRRYHALNGRPASNLHSLGPIGRALWDTAEQQGEGAVARSLERLRQEWHQFRTLSGPEREAWLRRVAHAD